jgi:ketosteroid isomerase-like protein
MSRYAAAIDERDLAGFAALFASDVEVVGFTRKPMVGAREWVAFVEKTLDGFSATQHMLGPQLAAIESDTANARTDLQAIHVMKQPAGEIFTLWGTYETRMRRDRDGDPWKIARHALVVRAIHNRPDA